MVFASRRVAIVVLGIAVSIGVVSCEDEGPSCVAADQCGIVCDQATVVFEAGTTRDRVDDINAEIGASVIIAPVLSTAYRIQVPPAMDFDETRDFYMSKADVVAVLWATNFCTQAAALDMTAASSTSGWSR